MKAHLRMSDVFSDGVYVGTDEWMNGWFEVRHVGGSSIDESCDGGHSERDANYVAHAINSHDELVAEVERLRQALIDAATSLETIHVRSYGDDSFLDSKQEMRSYAGSRARIARAALSEQ